MTNRPRGAAGRGGALSPSLGFGTIEVLIALSLLSVAVLTVGGLVMVSLSTGTAATTSSVATNLARARMEDLLSREPRGLGGENGSTIIKQIPAGQGPRYTIQTAVDASDPDLLDLTVTVTWRVAYGPLCAFGVPGGGCRASEVTKTRILRSRLKSAHAP